MERRLILRGIAAGGLAGLLAALFTRIMAEPWIQKSIDYQSRHDDVRARCVRRPVSLLCPPGRTSLAAARSGTSARRSA